jgi:hypothetical protein
LYALEDNYYAKYFSGVSGWYGVGYGDFGGTRGLTRGFAGDCLVNSLEKADHAPHKGLVSFLGTA